MLFDKLLYHLVNLIFQKNFDKEIRKTIKNKKRIVVFDVGCYRGTFTNKILDLLDKQKYTFYLFDVNRKVKDYLSNLTKLKNIHFNEVALTNKKGVSNFNYNNVFESAGSSLSNLVKDDKKWNNSRKFFVGLFFSNKKGYSKYKVVTDTLDNFSKKNKIKFIDILKIDVEGSEHDLLMGAKSMLKKNKFMKKEKKILSFLEKNNFSLIKKVNIQSISMFSDIKGGDYLLINKSNLNS